MKALEEACMQSVTHAVQSAKAEAKVAADRAAALQEQLEAVKLRLQEAHAAKQSLVTPSMEVWAMHWCCKLRISTVYRTIMH